MTPTPQQLAKAREAERVIASVASAELPCTVGCGDAHYNNCPAYYRAALTRALVPRVAALLAEVESRLLTCGHEQRYDDSYWGCVVCILMKCVSECDQNCPDIDEFGALKAENQRLAGELDSLSSLCAEVYQVVGTLSVESGRFDRDDEYGKATVKVMDALSYAANREYQGEDIDHGLLPFNAQPTSDCVEGLKARLNLKHSASPTDATQALCGAPPPFVWDNDSGVFCPACKKVETLSAEVEELRAEAKRGPRTTDTCAFCGAPVPRSERDEWSRVSKNPKWHRRGCKWATPVSHPPDEGEEKST